MLRNRKFTHHGRTLEVRTVKMEGRYTAAVYEQDTVVAPMEYAVSVLDGGGAAELDLLGFLWDTTESGFKRWSDFKSETTRRAAASARGCAAQV